jgi:hypothetical protein
MRHTVPVEDLLLFLSSDAIVLVKEIEERALRFFKRSIGPSLQVAQVGKDTFLEFLRILYWASESLESECKASNDIGS